MSLRKFHCNFDLQLLFLKSDQFTKVFPLTAGIFLVACTSPAEKKEKENLAIAERYMKAVESMNVLAMDSLLADNYWGYGPSVGDSINKEGAILNFKYLVENLYESFEYTRYKFLAVTVDEGEAVGDWVLNWAYLTIT